MIKNPEHRAEVERLWGVPASTIAPKPGYHAMELFKAMGDGRVRSALIMGSNPMQTLPNLNAFREKVKKCFIVVAEPFADVRTVEIADVVLPAALWVEKEGVYGQTERRYQLLEKRVDPPGEARSDLAILIDLAKRLKLDHIITAQTPEAVWEEWRQFSKGSKYDFSGITYPRLRKERGIGGPARRKTIPEQKGGLSGGKIPSSRPESRLNFMESRIKKPLST